MGEVYKARKIIYIIPMILFGGAFPLLVYIWIRDILDKGVTTATFAGLVCLIIDAGAFALFLYMFIVDPYAKLKKIQKENPELFNRINEDSKKMTELCKNVGKGEEFYFFAGRNKLLAVPIGQLRAIRVVSGYRKGIGRYIQYKIQTDDDKATVIVSVLGQDRERAFEVANMLAYESGIQAEIMI